METNSPTILALKISSQVMAILFDLKKEFQLQRGNHWRLIQINIFLSQAKKKAPLGAWISTYSNNLNGFSS